MKAAWESGGVYAENESQKLSGSRGLFLFAAAYVEAPQRFFQTIYGMQIPKTEMVK